MKNYEVQSKAAVILSAISVCGVIATAIFSARDHQKARKKLDGRKVMELKPKEFIKDVAPCYIPTITCIAGTGLCVIGSGILNKKARTSLVGAFEISRSLYDEYRQGAKDVYGDDADDKIKDAILKKKVTADPTLETRAPGCNARIKKQSEGEVYLFYEEIGETYIEATLDQIKDAMYHLNRNFILRGGYAQFIEFYEFLNLKDHKPRVGLETLCWHGGDDFGCQIPLDHSMDVGIDELWFARGDSGYEWIDYDIRETDIVVGGQKVYRITFPFLPDVCDDIY